MKVAFIHNEKKIGTGAHYINDLMFLKLREQGVEIKNFYPRTSLVDTPTHLGGLKAILFFYSLLERRGEILKFHIIQGTTYTALPFLAFPVPIVSHFGSTTRGFLEKTPLAKKIRSSTRKAWYTLKKEGGIRELNIKTRRPLRDIADIEEYVASRAAAVIATSENVRRELIRAKVPAEKIHLIHNAIEDYWFETAEQKHSLHPSIVFLGRLGHDAFTLKLKGLDRLVDMYQKFHSTPKVSFCMTTNKALSKWLRERIPNHFLHLNIKKDMLPGYLSTLRGSVLFIPSRYEGFSLSLIEGMSQGLIPVIYAVGVAPEIIEQGKNGYIVSSQQEAEFLIQEILSNPSLRRTLSKEAIKTSRQFSSDKIARKLIELYRSIENTRSK